MLSCAFTLALGLFVAGIRRAHVPTASPKMQVSSAQSELIPSELLLRPEDPEPMPLRDDAPPSYAQTEPPAPPAPPIHRSSSAPSEPTTSEETVDLWLYQEPGGPTWGAVANRSQLALWLQYELGEPASELEPQCVLERLPLAKRGTQRRLRRLWRDRRLLLQGVQMNELTAPSAGSSRADGDWRAERAFRRKLAGYVRRVQRLTPSRHETASPLFPP